MSGDKKKRAIIELKLEGLSEVLTGGTKVGEIFKATGKAITTARSSVRSFLEAYNYLISAMQKYGGEKVNEIFKQMHERISEILTTTPGFMESLQQMAESFAKVAVNVVTLIAKLVPLFKLLADNLWLVGAYMGFKAGMSFGPWGAIVGGLAGGIGMGLLSAGKPVQLNSPAQAGGLEVAPNVGGVQKMVRAEIFRSNKILQNRFMNEVNSRSMQVRSWE